jgi:hypothetical protein
MPGQVVLPGQLQVPFQRELQLCLQQRIVQRLWAKDPSLWPEELTKSNRALAKMDWLSLPESLPQFLEFLHRTFVSADEDGLVNHALLTSESLNLSARAFLELSGNTSPKSSYLR